MKLTIDTDQQQLSVERDGESRQMPLYSKAAFELLSEQWVKVGWNQKYSYTFSWFGRPVIQLPEDMLRMQEVIYRIKPDVIIETGVAHGGSLIYYASLCQAMGRGHVVGVDLEIRPHNRQAIESHELGHRITLIEGDSVGTATIRQVNAHVRPSDRVLVILDSCHTKQHVAAELEAYSGLVTMDSYIVATDGIMRDLHDVPRGDKSWQDDHACAAASEFLQRRKDFILEQPAWPFNESELSENITHWPAAWLRRVHPQAQISGHQPSKVA